MNKIAIFTKKFGGVEIIKKILLILILLVATVSTNQEELNEFDVCPFGLCFGIKCDND